MLGPVHAATQEPACRPGAPSPLPAPADDGEAGDRFWAGLQARVAAHRALRHPFLRRFRDERLGREQLRAFALQHYLYGRHFARHLGAALAITPDENARSLIILNLYDEIGGPLRLRDRLHVLLLQEGLIRPEDLGAACLQLAERRGDDLVQILIERGAVTRDQVAALLSRGTREAAELTHPAVFRRFLGALGLRPDEIERAEPIRETAEMIAEHRRLCSGDWLEALGAMGPGTECVVPTLYSYIEAGLRRSGVLARRDYLFWTLHIQCDDGHGANLIEAARPYAGEPDAQARIERGAMEALDARARWLDGLARLVFQRGHGGQDAVEPDAEEDAGPALSRPLRISRALRSPGMVRHG